MDGIMGGKQLPTQNPALPFFGLTFTVLVAVTVIGVVGLAYYFVLPEIKTGSLPAVCESVSKDSI